jgi:hypothetical protein
MAAFISSGRSRQGMGETMIQANHRHAAIAAHRYASLLNTQLCRLLIKAAEVLILIE